MQPDKIHSDADGYYGDNDANTDELDLSFLDKDDEEKPKK